MNRHLIAAGLAVLAASAFGASDGVVHADMEEDCRWIREEGRQ